MSNSVYVDEGTTRSPISTKPPVAAVAGVNGEQTYIPHPLTQRRPHGPGSRRPVGTRSFDTPDRGESCLYRTSEMSQVHGGWPEDLSAVTS